MSSPSKNTNAVSNEANDASKMGTKLTREVNHDDLHREHDGRDGRFEHGRQGARGGATDEQQTTTEALAVWEATSDPNAAPACIAGASSPPEPPNPTDNTLVTTGQTSTFASCGPGGWRWRARLKGCPAQGGRLSTVAEPHGPWRPTPKWVPRPKPRATHPGLDGEHA